MKKFMWVLPGVLTIIFSLSPIVRANPIERGILINEVQTGSVESASEEFIELYNANDQPVHLSNYRVEYFPASVEDFASPSRSIALKGMLAPKGKYLLSSTGYLQQANTTFGATLAKTGGHLRVVQNHSSGVVVDDVLGWGSAKLPENRAAAAPDSGKSILRKSVEEMIQDTDDNHADFEVSETPSPESIEVSEVPVEPEFPEEPEVPEEPQPEIPEPETPEPELPEQPNPELPEAQAVLPIHITELLPNPGSPKTDTNDEFIEIYNPNNEPVELEGFKLETGNDFNYSFTFGARVIGSQQYLVLMASETNLTLANSGGKARLIHLSGTVLSETMAYDEAKDDMSWAVVGSVWQWTATATPGQANLITSQTKDETAAAKLKKAAAKPKATKASTKAASTKAKTASAKATGKQNENEEQIVEEKKKLPMQPLILAGVGTLAVGYAAYEYRSDIANTFRKFRRFRKGGSAAGE